MSTDLDYAIFRASNRQNMKLWLDALLSGDYAQVEGVLRAEVGGKVKHCCLGVATEVFIKKTEPTDLRVAVPADTAPYISFEGGYTLFTPDGVSEKHPLQLKHNENGSLPEPVRQWLGLQTSNPSITRLRNEGVVEATGANDTLKWDFARIAEEATYTYMIDFTNEQVLAAAKLMIEKGNPIEAIRIMEMLFREEGLGAADLPSPPDRSKYDKYVKLPTDGE